MEVCVTFLKIVKIISIDYDWIVKKKLKFVFFVVDKETNWMREQTGRAERTISTDKDGWYKQNIRDYGN